MKLLLVSNLFPTAASPTGGKFVEDRIRAYIKQGVQITAVALRPRPPKWIPTSRNPILGERFIEVRVPTGPIESWRIRKGDLAWRAIRRAPDFLMAHATDIDVIVGHGHYPLSAAGTVSALGERLGIPSIGIFHGSDINHHYRRDPARSSAALARLSHGIFVSDALQESAKRQGFAIETSVIPNGVDLDLFSLKNTDMGQQGTRAPTLGFVGNLLPVKGADRLPAIMGHLREMGHNARLIIAGDGPLQKELEMSLKDYSVEFLGRVPQSEVAATLRRTDVLILPSRSEGWPCVVNEAFASGTTVVGTAVGGVEQAIGSGGTTVPAGEGVERRLAEAITAEFQHMRSPTSQRALAQGISWDEVANRELAVLRAIT